MSRNGEAHDGFYGARNHGGAESAHPLMSTLQPTRLEKDIVQSKEMMDPERYARFQKSMSHQWAGGWAGHGVAGHAQTYLGSHIAAEKRDFPEQTPKMPHGTFPKKRFRPPKGQGRA